MTLLRCHIAGIPHRKPAALPTVGDVVLLVSEPTNEYDPNAIKVMWIPYGSDDPSHLGYIPKVDTATVRQFGWTEMKVVEVVPERKWSEVIIEDIQEDEKCEPEITEIEEHGCEPEIQ